MSEDYGMGLKYFGFTFDEFTELDCRVLTLFTISQILSDVMLYSSVNSSCVKPK